MPAGVGLGVIGQPPEQLEAGEAVHQPPHAASAAAVAALDDIRARTPTPAADRHHPLTTVG